MFNKRYWVGFAALAVIGCAGGKTPGGPDSGSPGKVADLRVADGGGASLTLAFTEVGNGQGRPASYEIRRASGSSISWSSATVVSQGKCAAPVAGAAVGATRSCVISGLSPSTDHQFQMIAFRGKLNQDAVFGELSNIATSGGGQPQPGDTTVSTVTVTPASGYGTVDGTARFTALAHTLWRP